MENGRVKTKEHATRALVIPIIMFDGVQMALKNFDFSNFCRVWSIDRDKLIANKLIANQQFRHSDLVTVILSQSEGLGKIAMGIVNMLMIALLS